jgi:cytochrome c-type biogenesis protein CcmH/NrfG
MTMETVSREIAALKGLLEQEPENTTALIRLGNIYFDAGMFEAAQEYYERALRLEPDNVEVRTDLGTSLRSLERPQEALEQFEQAVRVQPDHWRGWFNIGIVALYDLGDLGKASAAFERVAEIKPGTVDMGALKKEIDRVRAEGAAGGGSS